MMNLARLGILLACATLAFLASGCESCGFGLSPRRTLVSLPHAVDALFVNYEASGLSDSSVEQADPHAWWILRSATGGLVGGCWYPEFTLRAQSTECTYAPATVPRAEGSDDPVYSVTLVCEGEGESIVSVRPGS